MEIDKTLLTVNEDFYFIEHIASDAVRRMSYPQFTETFYKVLRIKRPGNESIIGEIKQKRNEVIHKNLKMNFKHKKPEHEHINPEYLTYSLNEYTVYLNSLKTEISSRYAKCTRLNALRELWHYTFATPLFAVFKKFWHIDTDSDTIVGYKTVESEANLSHTEAFMLSIWRSQVSNCKLDFINMSSLGNHMQFCLYAFLKLSNDIFMYQ